MQASKQASNRIRSRWNKCTQDMLSGYDDVVGTLDSFPNPVGNVSRIKNRKEILKEPQSRYQVERAAVTNSEANLSRFKWTNN